MGRRDVGWIENREKGKNDDMGPSLKISPQVEKENEFQEDNFILSHFIHLFVSLI